VPRRNNRRRKRWPQPQPSEEVNPTPDQLARRLVARGLCSHLILIPNNRPAGDRAGTTEKEQRP
jgi:hypothetical protein